MAPASSIDLARRHDGNSAKLKSMMVGLPLSVRGLKHGLRAREIGGKRLLHEDRLAEVERAARDVGLPIGRNRDRDGLDGAVLDQGAPVTEAVRDVGRARELGRPGCVGPGERHDLATWLGPERRQQDGSSVIAADDAHADHSSSPSMARRYHIAGVEGKHRETQYESRAKMR